MLAGWRRTMLPMLIPEPPPRIWRPVVRKQEFRAFFQGLYVVEAIEVIKLIRRQTLTGQMLTLDTMSLDFRKLKCERTLLSSMSEPNYYRVDRLRAVLFI